MSRVRGWIFTINNYTESDSEAVRAVECRCIKAGFEVAPSTGTPHIQGAIYWDSGVTKSTACRRLGGRASVRVMRGSWEKQDYCLKDGNILRNEGEPPEHGKRSDIAEFREAIKEGLSELEAYELYPQFMARYPRFYGGYRDQLQRKSARSWMTKGTWFWGETGAGKSHRAFEHYDPETYFVLEAADNGWWDDYDGQETVIINEFRAEIKYSELLSLVDKWPKKVKRRGRPPTPFLAKHVIITCSMKPEELFVRQVEKADSIDQLTRRFQIIEVKKQ